MDSGAWWGSWGHRVRRGWLTNTCTFIRTSNVTEKNKSDSMLDQFFLTLIFVFYCFCYKLSMLPWRRKWQPTPAGLPGKSQGRRSLVGCRLWGSTE